MHLRKAIHPPPLSRRFPQYPYDLGLMLNGLACPDGLALNASNDKCERNTALAAPPGGTCVHMPCPPESAPKGSDLNGG